MRTDDDGGGDEEEDPKRAIVSDWLIDLLCAPDAYQAEWVLYALAPARISLHSKLGKH